MLQSDYKHSSQSPLKAVLQRCKVYVQQKKMNDSHIFKISLITIRRYAKYYAFLCDSFGCLTIVLNVRVIEVVVLLSPLIIMYARLVLK